MASCSELRRREGEEAVGADVESGAAALLGSSDRNKSAYASCSCSRAAHSSREASGGRSSGGRTPECSSESEKESREAETWHCSRYSKHSSRVIAADLVCAGLAADQSAVRRSRGRGLSTTASGSDSSECQPVCGRRQLNKALTAASTYLSASSVLQAWSHSLLLLLDWRWQRAREKARRRLGRRQLQQAMAALAVVSRLHRHLHATGSFAVPTLLCQRASDCRAWRCS